MYAGAAAFLIAIGTPPTFAQPSGADDYATNCARCHGPDGKGNFAGMRAAPGYRSVDLTQLSKKNGGAFPRQRVTDSIDGRIRIGAHYRGDMPLWGNSFKLGGADDQAVKRRIAALVDYIESLQEKSEATTNR